jgi:ATP-dependent helicase Lhr and Lhr-like helicase
MVYLAATDPANPYGSVLRWPAGGSSEGEELTDTPRQLTRSVGASVVLRNGELVAYLRRNNPNVQVFLPGEEPDRTNVARDLSHFLATIAQEEMRRSENQRGGLLISTINGQPAGLHFLGRFLRDAGFQIGPSGFNLSRALLAHSAAEEPSLGAH